MASIDLQIYVPGVAVVDISIDDSEDVSALLRVANVALRGRIKSKVLQLIPPRSARPLRPLLPLRRAGLRCGDLLTAQLKAVPEVVVTEKTFAAITPCGSVATWGALGAPGGNTSPVSDQLEKVIELTASRSALAALKADGSVVCWGAIKGGCSIVSELREVHRLFATHGAFAALTTDGTVRCWGDPFAGGDVAEAAKDLEAGGFEHIFATGSAFCALRSDSARGGAAPVVAWGEILQGGRAPEGLEAVRHIYATSGGAFAAIQEDGAVVTWGSSVDGGDSCRVQEELKRRGVRDIYSTDSAFAALTADGGLLAWGNARLGGVAPGEEALRRGGVRHLCSTAGAFAARCGDGTVLCWGLAEWGGSCRAICEDLKEVRFLHSTSRAFAAQRYDGRVLCWGDANSGGDVEEVETQLACDIAHVYPSSCGFAAVALDGQLVTWGGRRGEVAEDLTELLKSLHGQVQHIYATENSFTAFTANGTGFTWGAMGLAEISHFREAEKSRSTVGAWGREVGSGSGWKAN